MTPLPDDDSKLCEGSANPLWTRLNWAESVLEPGAAIVQRKLSDLAGVFAEESAYQNALAENDPLVYRVSSLEPGNGPGDLHYGLGMLAPGRVGREYYMTKGHFHTRREAAEVYLGLRGEGAMLLQDERTGESHLVPLEKDSLVYVPGYTAHRTVNVGKEPLVYLGIYPADAGHDYGPIAKQNFRQVVLAGEHGPELIDRDKL